jgi:hypothetical protein
MEMSLIMLGIDLFAADNTKKIHRHPVLTSVRPASENRLVKSDRFVREAGSPAEKSSALLEPAKIS